MILKKIKRFLYLENKLKKYFLLFIVLSLCLYLSNYKIFALNNETSNNNSDFNEIFISENYLNLFPSYFYINSIFENLSIFTLVQTDETYGFSKPDLIKISMFFDSWILSRYKINGFDFSDPLFTGSSIIIFPVVFIEKVIFEAYLDSRKNNVNNNINLIIKNNQKNLYFIGGLFPFEGTPTYWQADLFRFFNSMGIFLIGLHPLDRNPPPPQLRKRSLYNFDLGLKYYFDKNKDKMILLYLFSGSRRFLNFNIDGSFKNLFYENYFGYTLYFFKINNFGQNIFTGINYLFRDKLFSEFYYNSDETGILDRFIINWGINEYNDDRKVMVNFKAGIYKISHNNPEFIKDIIDPDGEGLKPFYPDGIFKLIEFDYNYKIKALYSTGNIIFNYFEPLLFKWSNQITYNSNNYGFIEHSSNKSYYIIGNLRNGLLYSTKLDNILEIYFNFYINTSFLINKEFSNSFILFSPNVKLGVLFRLKNYKLIINTGIDTIEMNSSYALKINPDILNSTYYLNNYSFILYSEGGKYLEIDNDLKAPKIFYFSIDNIIRISNSNQLRVSGEAKLFYDLFTIKFKGDPENYGYYEDGIFYYNNGYTNFILTNYNYSKLPFATGLYIEYKNEDDFQILKLSVAAYMVIGATPFGNGVLNNDLLVLDYSTANPDSYINAYGRVDLDRAYMIKLFYAIKLFKTNNWFSFSLKYRDGQPFAFYKINTSSIDSQIALTYNTIQGENEYGLKGGPREDSIWNFDLMLSGIIFYYNLKIKYYLIFSNFFDLENELAENVFSGGNRASLELIIPSAIYIGFQIFF